MRWSVVLASPCLCTQDALPPRQDYAITRAAPPLPAARLARLGGSFAAVVVRWSVADESWPSSVIATGYIGR